MKNKALTYIMTGLLVWSFGIVAYAAQEKDSTITVKVRKNQSIRDISGEYLNDPDLWEDILRANHLKSPDKVQPGMMLNIPVYAISRANTELEASKKLIEKATRNGAAIFAPKMIASAVDLRDKALEERKKGAWTACTQIAESSSEQAKKAFVKSMKNQNALAEALADYVRGQVHRRKPPAKVWKDVSSDDILYEGEVIRTLSDSFAEIVLRNNSRLQVKANSQVLIEKMRKNLLEDTEESEITLFKGDVFAMLTGGRRDDKFRFNIPGVAKAKVKSRKFRVGVEKDETRISNYEGQFEIESPDGDKVVLGENQGSVVRNQKPSQPQDLLPAPELTEPPDGAKRYNISTILISWKPVTGAEGYLLEFSDNTLFSGILWTEHIRDTRKKFPPPLGTGAFYWRVSAVSPDGLTGPPAKARFIRVVTDEEPPFLVIRSPEEGEILSENTVEISGGTENSGTVTIGEHPVEADGKGEFRFSHPLTEGENIIHIRAADGAGNITALKRTVIFVPARKSTVTFGPRPYQISPGHFLVNNNNFMLSGKTHSGSFVRIRRVSEHGNSGNAPSLSKGEPFSAGAKTDAEGRFQISIRTASAKDTFSMEVVSQTGEVEEERFVAETYDKSPIIRFSAEIPALTNQTELLLTGEAEGEINLTLNGQEVKGTFETGETETGRQFPLSLFRFPISFDSGRNRLCVTATDPLGNVSAIEKEILSDAYPPLLINYSLSHKRVSGGEDAKITLKVQDATAIAKTAPFRVRIGEYIHAGYLTRSGAGKYTGSFRVPNNVSGKLKLRQITLSDYLGNKKEYGF